MSTFLIITPVLNGDKFLLDNCQQMLRVKRQAPETNVIWLIRDGGSCDQTLSLLRQWISQHGYHYLRTNDRLDIRIFSGRDQGMYDAINKGIIYAKEENIDHDIFCWLNADDRMADNSFNSMQHIYETSSRQGWYIARGIDIDAQGQVIANQPHDVIALHRLQDGDFNYRGASWVKAESCFFSQQIIQRLGGFHPMLRLAGDYDLILRAATLAAPVYADQCESREFRRWEGQQSTRLVDYEVERKKVYTHYGIAHRQQCRIDLRQQAIKETIFFYPDYSNGNGYQEELYRGTNAYGYPSIEHLIKAEPRLQKGEIFHLHWLNDITNRTSAEAAQRWQWLRGFILRCKEQGAILIWTVHNISSHENRNMELEQEIVAFLIQECDRCHMHDQLVVYAFERRYGILPWGRLRIAEHGAYPRVDGERSARVLSEFGLLATDAYVVIPGQIRHYKNLPLLAAGLAHIHDTYPDLTICLLGQFHPELDEKDGKLIKEPPNVRWLSYRLNDEQYSAFVRDAAFALLTYVDVSTSGAVIHCLSQSCRVVAPRIGSIPSLVQSSDQGFLYDNNDDRSFFSAIQLGMVASQENRNPAMIASTVSHLDWSSILPRILSP
jgi:glycosyltransferase involved in cell wall biosynthesis